MELIIKMVIALILYDVLGWVLVILLSWKPFKQRDRKMPNPPPPPRKSFKERLADKQNECSSCDGTGIMNRYLAFFGDNYYPEGGMGDFLKDFETLSEAKDSILDKFNESKYRDSWGHVYDTVNKEIVFKK